MFKYKLKMFNSFFFLSKQLSKPIYISVLVLDFVLGPECVYHDIDHSVYVVLRLPVPFGSGLGVIKYLRPRIG